MQLFRSSSSAVLFAPVLELFEVESGEFRLSIEAESAKEAAKQFFRAFPGPFGLIIAVTGPDDSPLYFATKNIAELKK